MIGCFAASTVVYSVVMKRSKASRASCGQAAGHRPGFFSGRGCGRAARIVGQEIRFVSLADDLWLDGLHLAPPGGLQRLLGVAVGDQRLEVLDRREDQRAARQRMQVERALRREPAGVDGL